MDVDGKPYRTVWMEGHSVYMIDQNLLPFEFRILECKTYRETCKAITEMHVRGAGAIGAAAGYAMAQAFLESPVDPRSGEHTFLDIAKEEIGMTRPTAQNLFMATNRVYSTISRLEEHGSPTLAALTEARQIADEDAESCRKIGLHGAELIKDHTKLLTHCNAGWLAFVDYGSALSPVYLARQQGKKGLFVHVDETRPRGQGARLTAWELHNQGIDHAIIADNAAAHMMAQGFIDLVIVGADRIAMCGDVANKIGTLEKAIVAREMEIPFYVAAPLSTFDDECQSGLEIQIEQRHPDELLYQTGMTDDGRIERIRVANPGSRGHNPAFDVTPAKFITGIITPKGIIPATTEAIKQVIDESRR